MAFESELKKTALEYAAHQVASCRNLIGKPSSEIQTQLMSEFQHRTKAIEEFQGGVGEEWYAGTASVTGFIYGDFKAQFRFGDGNDWAFEGSWWGGVGAGSAAGGGPWATGFIHPTEGETMHFQVAIGAVTAGEIQAFWWRPDGPIIGSFVGIAAGLGAGGGAGKGKWKKV